MESDMSREIISKATRNEFREVFTYFSLHQIDMMFEAAELKPDTNYVPNVGGQRRGLVEQYYVAIDFTRPANVQRVLAAYEELLIRLDAPGSIGIEDNKRDEMVQKLLMRMEHDGFRYENRRFVSDQFSQQILQTPSIIALTSQAISEHIEKARYKIGQKDFAGAITNAYTLMEGFLKEVLRQTKTPFKESEGDIRSLYASVTNVLNLNPKGENLDSYLKTILQGLRSIIAGLYDVANKASDRHARKYNPAEHHAKLAVNAALAVCEFVLDSYEYQQNLKARKTKA
jgi:hypothetical protein